MHNLLFQKVIDIKIDLISKEKPDPQNFGIDFFGIEFQKQMSQLQISLGSFGFLWFFKIFIRVDHFVKKIFINLRKP